jgi:hypothetical protein
MNIYDGKLDELKEKIMKAFDEAPLGLTPVRLLTLFRTENDSSVKIYAALFELSDENRIRSSLQNRKDAGAVEAERVWFTLETCPRPTLGSPVIKAPRVFGLCPACHGHKFEAVSGGAMHCRECGLHQGGIFEETGK